jgi:hypothetical protein
VWPRSCELRRRESRAFVTRADTSRYVSVKYDKDGIDIYFMNNDQSHLKNVCDVSTVREAFDQVVPFGSTP